MSHLLKYIMFLIIFSLVNQVSSQYQVAQKPQLYGKVFLKFSVQTKPLSDARIELLEVKQIGETRQPGSILYITYTAWGGKYAFYRIPKGNYYLRIIMGKRVLFQIVGDQNLEEQLIRVSSPDQPTNLPDIMVSF